MEWLSSILENDFWVRVVAAVIIVIVFYMMSRFARSLLNWLGHKVFARTQTFLDDKILEVVLAHVKPLMVVIGFYVGIREVRNGTPPSALTIHQILDYSESLLYIVAVVVAFKILLGVVSVLIDWYLDKVSAEGSGDLKRTLGPLTGKVVDLLVGMVAIIVVLDHFGINIGSLLVSLGVGSLAVALAAQDTIANMIAGFVILVDRPFRVGDRIDLGAGVIGDVQVIGLRSTRLLNFDSNLIIIPNGDMVKARIVNFAYPHNQIKVQLKVGVSYGTDPEQVRRMLLDLAAKHPDVLKDPAPEVHLTDLADSAVEFTLIARGGDYTKKFAAENLLRERAYLAFAKAGIEIPFPQRVVHTKIET